VHINLMVTKIVLEVPQVSVVRLSVSCMQTAPDVLPVSPHHATTRGVEIAGDQHRRDDLPTQA
jgi:hypothetical protein